MSDATDLSRRIELERADAAKRALSDVLAEIDGLQGNDLYRRAWKKIALKVSSLMRKEIF